MVRTITCHGLIEGETYIVDEVDPTNDMLRIVGGIGWFSPKCFSLYTEEITEEHTGGSSSYYDLKVGDTTIKCLDIIEGLNMSYNEGNILKAVWRIAAAKQGKCKKGNNKYYDSEKIVFFGERLLEEHKA